MAEAVDPPIIPGGGDFHFSAPVIGMDGQDFLEVRDFVIVLGSGDDGGVEYRPITAVYQLEELKPIWGRRRAGGTWITSGRRPLSKMRLASSRALLHTWEFERNSSLTGEILQFPEG